MPTNIVKPLQWYDWNRDHPLASGLAGLWPFLRGMGPEVMDVSGHDNHIDLSTTEWVASSIGPVIEVDAGDEALLTYSPVFPSGTSSFTISTWAKKTSGSLQVVWDNNTGSGYAFLSVSTSVNFAMGAHSATWANDITDGLWHHFACVRVSGVGHYLYVDGVLRASNAGSGAYSMPASNMGIGWQPVGSPFTWTGLIGDFIWWDRPLTAAEVVFVYAKPNALITPPDDLSIWAAAIGGAAGPNSKRFSLLGIGA